MSDEQDKPVEDQKAAEPQGPRGGELLADARREQQISVLDIAKELHLDEPKVRALERNEFDMLGAPVFAKGHLRKYAELVGIDPDDVLEDYYKMTRQEPLPPVVVARRRMRHEVSPGPWIAAIIVILVVAASYWWFAVFSGEQPAPATQPQSAPAQQGEDMSQGDVAEPAQSMIQQEPEPTVAEPEPVSVERPVADGEVALSLAFSGDCWTEISDATGRRLLFEMGRAGDTVDLAGVAPFAVLFGNVDNVTVRVDGNDYPLSSSNPGSRMARLTIMAP
jgi:cytoskeleton protein RodZ